MTNFIEDAKSNCWELEYFLEELVSTGVREVLSGNHTYKKSTTVKEMAATRGIWPAVVGMVSEWHDQHDPNGDTQESFRHVRLYLHDIVEKNVSAYMRQNGY